MRGDLPDIPDEGAWFPIEPDGGVGGVRRAAARLGERLGLGEERLGHLGLVVAELASNLAKHADGGAVLVRPLRTGEDAGVELIAVDSGPGMASVHRSARDGHSTAGTLGIGLGTIARQASWFDLHSARGRGTVLAAQVWADQVPPPAPASGLIRPMTGESASGDGYAVRRLGDGGLLLLMCDGLGHGSLAALATRTAVRAFAESPATRPAALVEALHVALRPTRGAAVAVALLDPAAGVAHYAGLGNVAGTILTEGARRGMISMPGIAGHQRRVVREFDYPLPPGAVVVLHTDGVTSRWSLDDYPGLLQFSPQVIAAVVLRDAGVRRDDAGVLVART